MTYSQAVSLALQGKEEGYRYLYESTYQSKFYLAVKYMNRQEAAEDVLQEAYAKAFSKLDTLKEPEAFPGWLGMIVANEAKNALQKNNPLLFSEVQTQEDEDFIPEVEDTREEAQPELSYSRKETQELVREMINALSEEQRVCILMFEIEGIPIKDIAASLGCSENTVKSRLNYGRKNLKKKAEELQKKGYKLYSVAPLALFAWLLAQEQGFTDPGVAVPAWETASRQLGTAAGKGAVAGKAAAAGKAGAFIHTLGGKITLTLVGTAMALGVAAGGAALIQNSQPQTTTPETTVTQPVDTKPVDTQPETTQTTETEPVEKEMEDGDFASLLAGGFTRQELEQLLAYGPETLDEQGIEGMDLLLTVNAMCQSCEDLPPETQYIGYLGYDAQYVSRYVLADVNRALYLFTDFQLSPENTGANGGDYFATYRIDGEALCFSPATINYDGDVKITAARYTPEEMILEYAWHRTYYDMGKKELTLQKRAVLTPDAEGKFRIRTIENLGEQKGPEALYADFLEELKTGDWRSLFQGEDYTGELSYFIKDLDGDGVPELVLGARCKVSQMFYGMDCIIYRCAQMDGGYALSQMVGKTVVSTSIRIPGDGQGLLTADFSRMSGMYSVSRITLNGAANTLESQWLSEYDFIMGSSEEQAFLEANPEAEWISLI